MYTCACKGGSSFFLMLVLPPPEKSLAHPVSTDLLTEICNSIFQLKDEKSVLDVKPMSWKGSFFFVFPVRSGVSTHDTSVRRSSQKEQPQPILNLRFLIPLPSPLFVQCCVVATEQDNEEKAYSNPTLIMGEGGQIGQGGSLGLSIGQGGWLLRVRVSR